MPLDIQQLEQIKAAAQTPTSHEESEILRGYVGILLDELSVAGGIIGGYTYREIAKTDGIKSVAELRTDREYADRLVRNIHRGVQR